MGCVSKFNGRFLKSNCNVQIGNCGILNGCVLKAGVLISYGTGCNYDITGLNVKVDSSAGTGSNEGITAALNQLFNCDGC